VIGPIGLACNDDSRRKAPHEVDNVPPAVDRAAVSEAPLGDWDEPRPQGIDWETVDRLMTALRQLEIGRAPETQWELECYAAAYAAGIVSRPL
jgi:hypothetical protein